MTWEWLNKIINKVASEVHKSKIEEFEKRILEIERKQEVILKTLFDNQNKLDKLDDRLYRTALECATLAGGVKSFIQKETLSQHHLKDKINEQQINK